jgi:transcriptional regulator with XRE-family HTH domain
MAGNNLRTILSVNLKLFRHHKGWSQAILAEKAGISIPFLSSIERGSKWPYPETLERVARALEIEVFELFKPEKAAAGEVKEIMNRLVKDISISVQDSIETASRRYLNQ